MGLNERQKAMVIAGLDAGMSGKEVCNFVAQLSYESALFLEGTSILKPLKLQH